MPLEVPTSTMRSPRFLNRWQRRMESLTASCRGQPHIAFVQMRRELIKKGVDNVPREELASR